MDESRKLDRTWLCSIVFSDIVNYSSQSVEVQMKWKQYFNDVLTEALRSVPPDDRIVLDTGDGAAVCFVGDPEVALLSTLSMRRAFVDQAPENGETPRIRLGINLGPVKLVRDINGNLNALGDGINVAQRVMSFAAPNQVLVSQSYYEVVSRLSDDYKGIFRYDSVRKDKHVREHVVYEVTPGGTGTSLAVTVVDEPSTKTGESEARPKWRRALLAGGLGALLLVISVAVIVLRPKPQVPSQSSPGVSQVQSSSPGSNQPVLTPDAANEKQLAEAPRTMHPPPARAASTLASERKSAVRAARSASTQPRIFQQPSVAQLGPGVNGRWQADVKYSWGANHSEAINLKVDGGEVFGTASYVRTPRAILDGKLEGNQLTFTTRSQATLGDKTYEEKHLYRGRVSGDTIEFVLQTDSGYDSRPAETFTARRVPDGVAAK